MKRSERDLDLRLDSGRMDDTEPRCRVYEMPQQRALAAARIASHNQHSALPDTDLIEKTLERSTFF